MFLNISTHSFFFKPFISGLLVKCSDYMCTFCVVQLLTQICLALSALILHVVEHGKPIGKLFYSLQSLQSQDDGDIAVLEMLTVLPEVVDDKTTDCNLGSAMRCEYDREV